MEVWHVDQAAACSLGATWLQGFPIVDFKIKTASFLPHSIGQRVSQGHTTFKPWGTRPFALMRGVAKVH